MLQEISTLELLYFDDCPSWKNALEGLQAILDEHEISAQISTIRVETHDEAQRHKFVGSPTIRLNGIDLFPTDQDNYALGCRVYPTPEGLKGWPTKEMFLKRLELKPTAG